MIRSNSTFDNRILDGIDDVIANKGTRMAKEYEKITRSLRYQAKKELQFVPPKPPQSRYKRTGRLRKGWEVKFVREPNRGRITMRNAVSYGKWVQGYRQRSFHRKTGWVNVRTVREKYAKLGNQRLGEAWKKATQVRGGKP